MCNYTTVVYKTALYTTAVYKTAVYTCIRKDGQKESRENQNSWEQKPLLIETNVDRNSD